MTNETPVRAAAARRLNSPAELELGVPECAKGIGSVILSTTPRDLISGVVVQPFSIYPDDRGYFLEVQRIGVGLAGAFPAATTQVSSAVNYPGTVKAFHYHIHQTDFWTPLRGLFQVALVDFRLASPTFGVRNTLYVGTLRPWQILIPPGVGHGYKVIGKDDSVLVYLTDRFYNPQDEGRVPYNDASIQYDWEMQWK